MPASPQPPITCTTPKCNRLIEDAVPLPRSFSTRLSARNAQRYCSQTCFQRSLSLRITCQGKNCARLIRNAVPNIPGTRVPLPGFDTTKYCSIGCVEHIECNVCAISQPLTAYVAIGNTKNHYKTNVNIPAHCLDHIAPDILLNRYTGTCIDCITSYLTIRFEKRGANGLNCIMHGCNHHDNDDADWRPYALYFLPAYLHEQFTHLSMQTFVSAPEDEVYHQKQRELTHDDVGTLEAMARWGARRCPRCRYVIVKDGGCSRMVCERCVSRFNWLDAEQVRPLEKSVFVGTRIDSNITWARHIAQKRNG
jgi:hypothetical protein